MANVKEVSPVQKATSTPFKSRKTCVLEKKQGEIYAAY